MFPTRNGTGVLFIPTYIDHGKLEIRNRKFSWIGHTLRKEYGEVPKAALLWNPQGNRKRGRSKNSGRRSVIKEAGRSWNEPRFLAADRQKYQRRPYFGTLKETGREEDRETAGEDR
jgi:hypothetical protein